MPPISDLEGYRRSLHAAREQTIERVTALKSEFERFVAYSEGTPPDDEHDPEGSTIGFERAQLEAVTMKARAHLAEIDAALARLDEGSYGICERCGRAISPERLQARPHARTCATCH